MRLPPGPPIIRRSSEWDRVRAVTPLPFRLGGSIPHAGTMAPWCNRSIFGLEPEGVGAIPAGASRELPGVWCKSNISPCHGEDCRCESGHALQSKAPVVQKQNGRSITARRRCNSSRAHQSHCCMVAVV